MVLNLGNNPYVKIDSQGRDIQSSTSDTAFVGEYSSNNLIYKCFAKPGTLTSAAAWQIAKLTYDGSNNLLTVTWPQDAFGHPSSEYQFICNNRATYTYG